MAGAQRYISSIDGLRAFAVLAVLLFHVDVSWASGGFIGVDVFFVISGFLITRNIVREVETKQWSFLRFYIRRVARLFPALFVTVLATLIAAWWILAPSDLERIGQSSVMAVLSIGNVFFWLEAGYFDASAKTKPLLHTWSLSVEEQFYLVWPAIVVCLIAFGRRAALFGIAVLGVASLVAALVWVRSHPSAVFFLTPFRIHQFAVGAVLGLVGTLPTGRVSSALAMASIAGLCGLIFLVTDATDYVYAAILPGLIGTMALAGSQSHFSKAVLASAPMVWIGRRSYSIYLAHWPIIVLWKLATDLEFSPVEQVIAVVVSIVAGAVLFETVETRFRFKASQSANRKRVVMAFTSVLAAIAMSMGTAYWVLNGVPSRLAPAMVEAAGDQDDVWDERQRAVRDGVCSLMVRTARLNQYDRDICSSPPAQGLSYLVVGDSFANDTRLVLQAAYPDIYFGQLAVPGCLLRLPKQFENGEQKVCRQLYELALFELITDQNYDGIILSSNWQDRHYYRINDLINVLSGHSIDIIVVGQRIRFRNSLPSIVGATDSREAAEERARALIRTEEFAINTVIQERFSDRVKFLDFIALACPGACDVFDNEGALVYMDDSHLSLAGVRLIADRLRLVRPTL